MRKRRCVTRLIDGIAVLALMAHELVLPSRASAAITAAAAPAPLPSTGKWLVEFQETLCAMSHDYGTAPTHVTVGFRPWPMGAQTEVVVVFHDAPSVGPAYSQGFVQLDGGDKISGAYRLIWDGDKKARIATINVAQEALAHLADAKAVTIGIGREPPVTVLPTNLQGAQQVLGQCQRLLLEHWGIDPDEDEAVAQKAVPLNPLGWITADDYPRSALAANQSGIVTILWAIGADGRAHDCRIVGSSGTPALDIGACHALTRNARYRPARDSAGKPLVIHGTQRVIWLLPG